MRGQDGRIGPAGGPRRTATSGLVATSACVAARLRSDPPGTGSGGTGGAGSHTFGFGPGIRGGAVPLSCIMAARSAAVRPSLSVSSCRTLLFSGGSRGPWGSVSRNSLGNPRVSMYRPWNPWLVGYGFQVFDGCSRYLWANARSASLIIAALQDCARHPVDPTLALAGDRLQGSTVAFRAAQKELARR